MSAPAHAQRLRDLVLSTRVGIPHFGRRALTGAEVQDVATAAGVSEVTAGVNYWTRLYGPCVHPRMVQGRHTAEVQLREPLDDSHLSRYALLSFAGLLRGMNAGEADTYAVRHAFAILGAPLPVEGTLAAVNAPTARALRRWARMHGQGGAALAEAWRLAGECVAAIDAEPAMGWATVADALARMEAERHVPPVEPSAVALLGVAKAAPLAFARFRIGLRAQTPG